ncbi:alanine racemase [Lacisediminihabitans profunda]|uniref:Amino acid deaminase n=1 Tax=Lacisediminihabitans profunda TaxID=2594790 RepID=A0A5C8URK3_9MICO|nr:alanine racemase [Lacisediminihabitans profunda]TXN30922.1 amino acid deaminase [Lacisediminihabitans profunda]
MTRALLLDELGNERLSARDKGVPERAFGMAVTEFLASDPRLSEFWTPIVTLDDEAIENNLTVMAQWSASHGLELMPHGKTTMAPALWQRQLDAGSLGITLATMGQVRTARTFGLDSIMLANAAVDDRSLRYLATQLADPEFRFVCWADSIATVEAMESTLREARTPRPVDVCVEIGAADGRTGARTNAEALEVARRIAASDVLRLAGVAGYEGSLAHDRSDESLDAVRAYLQRQVELHDVFHDLYDDDGDVYVTAGGSAYFDLVAEAFASAIAADSRTLWTLRSGAYVVHDDGFYRGISPLDEGGAGPYRLRSAMRGIARVVSHPEPGLALLDGGKRDFPFDEGLPIPRQVASDLGQEWAPLQDASILAMNDQHSYLGLTGENGAFGAQPGAIGTVVALGLSHPCTTFDKWRYLPVVASQGSDRVVDLVRTFF